MAIPKIKRIVVGVAIASLAVYCVMGSLTNGESLANPNGIQLAVELLVIVSFFAAALLEKKSPEPPPPATPTPTPASKPRAPRPKAR